MSTGLACNIVEADERRWYYILQNWDCPVSTWDWREYATCYGPFVSEDAAIRHLSDNHANPGGWTTVSLKGKTDNDPVIEDLLTNAVKPAPRRVSRYGFGSY